MKKLRHLKTIRNIGIVLAAAFAFGSTETGCTKSSSSPAKDTLSSVTLASSISSLVTSSTSGVAPQAESNASMFQNMSFACGTILDTNFSGSITSSGMTMNYNLAYADTAFCSGSTLTKMDFYMNSLLDMTMSGMYVGGKSKTFMSMSGLDAASTNFVMSASSSCTDTIKETSPNTLTCYMNLNMTSSNITIAKSTSQITSGTSTISYSYTTSGGNTYTESATVKYLGSYMASITLANGYTTTVSW